MEVRKIVENNPDIDCLIKSCDNEYNQVDQIIDQKLFKNANNIITKLYEFTIKEISNFVYIFCVHMFLIYC